MTTSDKECTKIDSAIERASKELLESTIKAIYRDIPSAKDALIKKLFISEDHVPELTDSATHGTDKDDSDEDSKEDSKGTPAAQTTTGSKRLRTRYAVCINCDKEYDVADNTSKSCLYHPEKSEPDDDAFADHDEEIHGVIDSDWMREEYPDSFIHQCCGRNGEEDPCVNDWHREDETFKKLRIERE